MILDLSYLESLLESLEVDDDIIDKVTKIIATMSFKGGTTNADARNNGGKSCSGC